MSPTRRRVAAWATVPTVRAGWRDRAGRRRLGPSTWRRDRYVGDEVVRQLAGADLIVVTKIGPAATARRSTQSRRGSTASHRRDSSGSRSIHGDVPPVGPARDRAAAVGRATIGPSSPDAPARSLNSRDTTWSYETWDVGRRSSRCDREPASTRSSTTLPAGVLRLKGFVVVDRRRRRSTSNVVGRSSSTSSRSPHRSSPTRDGRDRHR